MNPTWQTDDGRVKLWLGESPERAHVCHVARLAAVVSILCYSFWEVVSLRAAVSARKVFAESVKLGVLHPSRQFKILDTVVRLVAVLVVNQIVRAKRPADVLLHDDAMLPPAVVLPVNLRRQNNVALAVDCGSSAKVVIASASLCGRFSLETSATQHAALCQRLPCDGLSRSAFAEAKPFVVPRYPRVIRQDRQATKDLAGKIGDFVHAAI